MTTLTDATVRFQCDRHTIDRLLATIAEEWTQAGRTEAVVDEYGEIHPDAEADLLDRV